MRRGIDAVLGLLLVLALAAALPAGLRLASGRRELRVTLRTPDPFEIVPRAGAEVAPAVAGPRDLLSRLELEGTPDRSDPGLWLRTWQVTYGHRWERQATVPVLAGPFDPEGKPWPCAVAVRFSPRFFDDGKPGGEDVQAVVDRVVRAQFPFDVLGLRFAAVASTSLRVRPVIGGVEVSGGVVLADSRRDPTTFTLKLKVALGERDGDLAARMENVAVTWRGSTRSDPMVAMASLFLDVDEQARRVVAEKLGSALAIFRLPKEPIALFEGRPADLITFRLCDAPESRPDGVTVRLRLVASLAEPRLDPRVPGPPHVEDRPTLLPPAADAPTLEAAVSAAGVQQALYVAWQGGALRAWGREERVVEAMRRKLEDRLAFELSAVDAALPPVVLPEGREGALALRFGALTVGEAGGRRVVANGDITARARVGEGTIGLAGTLSDLRVSCVEGEAAAWRITPCFSDVVPALRESGLTSEGLPLDLQVPDRLLRLNLVLGTELVLSGLTGEVTGTPPQLRLRGEARLARRVKP